MRSVSAKIIFWAVAALLISLAVFIMVSRTVIGGPVMESLDRYNSFHFLQARQAWQTGGPSRLSEYLAALKSSGAAEHHLTDARGRDLETGEDRSAIIRLMGSQTRWMSREDDQFVYARTSDDRQYTWVGIVRQPFSPYTFAPFYLLVLATVGALYWLVAARIAAPLRRLTVVVDRFGRGDLAVRSLAESKDEIGNLGNSFNAMAERIQTLLIAERQLLQDVSHELRSPLARLTFEAEMVRKTNDRDASAVRLRREIERLSELVGTLIEMARMEGDPATVDMEDVSLNDLLKNLTDDCAIEAEAHLCRVVFTASATLKVRGNAELLLRAFENVIRNAIRYSPPGAAVEIHLYRNDGEIKIAVRDHGPGLPENVIPRIFDPFFRADPSRDEATGGVGLGLAIARRAIRVHHGDITAENAHPGAILRFTLPVS
jgi:signal transduction histidine kinase